MMMMEEAVLLAGIATLQLDTGMGLTDRLEQPD